MRVLLIQETVPGAQNPDGLDENVWVAQCLEIDVAAHGTTMLDAQYAFQRALQAEVALAAEHGTSIKNIPPALDRYHQMWTKGAPVNGPHPLHEYRTRAHE